MYSSLLLSMCFDLAYPPACAGMLHPRLPPDTLERMVDFLATIHQGANVQHSFASAGGPWEFNLRDLLRWCHLAEHAVPAAENNTFEGERQVCNSSASCFRGCSILD